MPRLEGLTKMYNEIIDEERRSQLKNLNGLRNKIQYDEETIKPLNMDTILSEKEIFETLQKFQKELEAYSFDIQRTFLKISREVRDKYKFETLPNRDDSEMLNVIFFYNKLMYILQQKFLKGEITDKDKFEFRKFLDENGILQNVLEIKETWEHIKSLIDYKGNQDLIFNQMYNYLQSGNFKTINYPQSPIIDEEEEAPKPAPAPAPEGMKPELPYMVSETRKLREKLADLTPQQLVDGFQYYKYLRDEALSLGDRAKARQEQDRIDVLLTDPRLDEIFYAEGNIPPSPEELRPVGLGRRGGRRGGARNQKVSRFTPLRLYNAEGEDVYAMRRYES